MKYYFTIRIIMCSFLLFNHQIETSEGIGNPINDGSPTANSTSTVPDATDNADEEDDNIPPVIYTSPNPYDIDPALNEALTEIAPLMKLINRPSLTPTEDTSTEDGEAPAPNTTPQDEGESAIARLRGIGAADIAAGICRQIIEEKLRNFIATLALQGPHVLNVLGQNPSSLVKAFKGLLGKDQNNLNPLEQALKSNLTLLRSILNILDTTDAESRTQISSMLKSVASLEELYTFSRDAAVKGFYNQYFDDSSLKNPLDPTARDDFAKQLELLESGPGGSEAKAIAFFRRTLKPEFQKKAKALFRVWKENRIAPGKVGKILKSLAFIVEYPEITKTAFKGYSPIGLYLFAKNTPEKRKARLFAAIAKHNRENATQISIADMDAMWSEFDNFYKIISLGRFVSKAVGFAYSSVNFFRKVTFRSTRSFEEYEYKHATELQTDIQKSWVGTLVRTGRCAVRIGKALVRGVQGAVWLTLEVNNSRIMQGVYKLAGTARDKAGELLSGAMTRFTAIPVVSRGITRVQESTRTLFAQLAERAGALRGIREETIEPSAEDDTESGETSQLSLSQNESADQEAQGMTAAVTSWMMSAATRGGRASLSATTGLMTRMASICYSAAQADKPFNRDETTQIIAESATRQLIYTMEVNERTKGIISDEENQTRYEEQLEQVIQKNILSLLQKIRNQIDQEQQPKTLRGRYLPGFMGGQKKLTDDQYLERFNAILATQLNDYELQLRKQFDTIMGTIERDPSFLSESTRSKVKAFFDAKEKAIESEKGAIESDDEEKYNTKIASIITKNTNDLLDVITKQMGTARLSDVEYIARFNQLLEEQITTQSATLSEQFDSINSGFTRVSFEDAVEVQPIVKPKPARILPEIPKVVNEDAVTDYEKAAYDKLFTFPTDPAAQLSSFQKALQHCNSPLRTLLSFTIESTLLQSASYRSDLQRSGFKSFYQGLDSGNNVTRLVDGASSLNILKLAAKTDRKDLEALIKAARIVGTLAHDTLIEEFFTTHCTTSPEQRSAILEIMVNPTKNDQQKRNFLEPFFKPAFQNNASELFAMLQNHLNLPTRLETSLLFLEYQEKISECLKKSNRTDYAQDIFDKLNGKVELEKIRAMLPALQEYHKAMNFFNGRRMQFITSISYKLKNLFRALTPKMRMVNYTRNAFKAVAEFTASIKGSWLSGLKDAQLSESITNPQETPGPDLLQFIEQNRPEVEAPAVLPAAEEDAAMAELTSIPTDLSSQRIDIFDLFLRGLAGTAEINSSATSDQLYSETHDTLVAYITGSTTGIDLPLVKLIQLLAPDKLTDPAIRQKALCGLKLLDALQKNQTARSNEKLDRNVFVKLTEEIYAKVIAQLPGKASLADFTEGLKAVKSEELNRMIEKALSKDNIDDTATIVTTDDPLAGLTTVPSKEPIITPGRGRSGSTTSRVSTTSGDEEFFDTETMEEQEARLKEAAEEKRREEEALAAEEGHRTPSPTTGGNEDPIAERE